ncbi:hypothetical protein BBJ28_00017570 [Nothophytophthora sp. Chile5]|nr:hypothetical protein BBJ28_00017570 [Nothophytophthora sp. Chile5]
MEDLLGLEEPKKPQLVRLLPRYVRLRQGTETRYRLKLSRPPSKAVTIHVCVVKNKSGVTASPTHLVVTAKDWRKPREVVVSTAVDSELRTLQIHHKIHETYDEVYNSTTPLPSLFVSVLQKEATFLFGFGCGIDGRLGTSNEANMTIPTPFPCRWLHPVQLACGKAHSAIVDVYSNLYCFGLGASGQLGQGDDDLESSPEPTRVPQLTSTSVQFVACGSHHTLCLSVDGRVFAWGDNSSGQLGIGAKCSKPVATPFRVDKAVSVRSVACGGSQSFILAKTSVLAAGCNIVGQLGLGDRLDRANFEPVPFFSKRSAALSTSETSGSAAWTVEAAEASPEDVAISCGLYHTVALWAGRVYSWGIGDDGRLGHGNLESCLAPTLVKTLKDTPAVAVACGGSHSGAVAANGDVYTWGNGQLGQLGLGKTRSRRVPTRVHLLQGKGVTQLAFGEWHSMALCQDSTLFAWGFGEEGQLGLPEGELEATRRVALLPTAVHALSGTGATLVHCGGSHTFVVSVLENRRQKLAKVHRQISQIDIRREGDRLATRERRMSRQIKLGLPDRRFSRQIEPVSPRRCSSEAGVRGDHEPDKEQQHQSKTKQSQSQIDVAPPPRRCSSARPATQPCSKPATASAEAQAFSWKARPLSSRTSVRNAFRQQSRELDTWRDVLSPVAVLPERPRSSLGISPRLRRLRRQLDTPRKAEDPSIAQAVANAVHEATQSYLRPGSRGLCVDSSRPKTASSRTRHAEDALGLVELVHDLRVESLTADGHDCDEGSSEEVVLLGVDRRFGSCQALEADIRVKLSRRRGP